MRRTIASLGHGVKTFSESHLDAPKHPSAVARGANLMSALGHKRTLRRVHLMSALPPKADIAEAAAAANVAKLPKLLRKD